MNVAGSKGIETKEAPETAVPVCPHCKGGLNEIWIRKSGLGVMEQKQFLICPNCRALLGLGVLVR